MDIYLVESYELVLPHRDGHSRGVQAEGYTGIRPLYLHLLPLSDEDLESLAEADPTFRRRGPREGTWWIVEGEGAQAHWPGLPTLRAAWRSGRPTSLRAALGRASAERRGSGDAVGRSQPLTQAGARPARSARKLAGTTASKPASKVKAQAAAAPSGRPKAAATARPGMTASPRSASATSAARTASSGRAAAAPAARPSASRRTGATASPSPSPSATTGAAGAGEGGAVTGGLTGASSRAAPGASR